RSYLENPVRLEDRLIDGARGGPARARRRHRGLGSPRYEDDRGVGSRQLFEQIGQLVGAVSQQRELVLVQLDHVEGLEPLLPAGEGLRLPGSTSRRAEEEGVEVGIQGDGGLAAETSCSLEIELKPGDEVEVERVEPGNDGKQLLGGPSVDAGGKALRPLRGIQVAQLHAVVLPRRDADPPARAEAVERVEEVVHLVGQVTANLRERLHLPTRWTRRRHRREGVRDAAPLLDRPTSAAGVPDGIPYEGAEDAEAARAGLRHAEGARKGEPGFTGGAARRSRSPIASSTLRTCKRIPAERARNGRHPEAIRPSRTSPS